MPQDSMKSEGPQKESKKSKRTEQKGKKEKEEKKIKGTVCRWQYDDET